jgi:hypothetical protein
MREEKLKYVAPAADVRRVFLEANIVATVSMGRMSAQVNVWADGGEDILGDGTGEGGDIYLIW